MKDYEDVRLYNEKLNEWADGQIELSYQDFDNSGELIQTGSEDFSAARQKYIKSYAILQADEPSHDYAIYDYKDSIFVRNEDKAEDVLETIRKSSALMKKYNLDDSKDILLSFVRYGF